VVLCIVDCGVEGGEDIAGWESRMGDEIIGSVVVGGVKIKKMVEWVDSVRAKAQVGILFG